jgi:hypothetical protein
MEAEMRGIIAPLVGLMALGAVSVQAAPNPKQDHWLQLSAALSLRLGDQACSDGWHQALWRDWLGEWWWGPCVPDWR